jgi:hypothetical protein
MYPDLGPLPNLFSPAVLGLLGMAAGGWVGFWVERKIRRRSFFKKLGKIAVAKIPEKVSLIEVDSHSWIDPARYEQNQVALELLGFHRGGTFVASPLKWVAEFWVSAQPGLFAKIIDSDRGIFAEVTVVNADGTTSSFENTEQCEFQHRQPDRWVHCGLITPAQIVEKALREASSNDGKQMNLAECVSAYEQVVNEDLEWRRGRGFSTEEMRRVYDRVKKGARVHS